MNTQKKQNNTYIDYKAIREMGKRIDCTIVEADFNTSHPNPYRINNTAADINRYKMRAKNGKWLLCVKD